MTTAKCAFILLTLGAWGCQSRLGSLGLFMRLSPHYRRSAPCLPRIERVAQRAQPMWPHRIWWPESVQLWGCVAARKGTQISRTRVKRSETRLVVSIRRIDFHTIQCIPMSNCSKDPLNSPTRAKSGRWGGYPQITLAAPRNRRSLNDRLFRF